MTNRYHLPVIVTTTDEMDRGKAVEYVETMLENLEETDEIYRTYVEGSGIEDGEGERLLDMLSDLDEESLSDALDTIESLESDTDG